MLTAPSAAHAGTYVWTDPDTGDYSPVYSGGQASNGDGSTLDYVWGYYGYGQTAYGDNYYSDGRDAGSASCSGKVTATFRWKPDYPGEPPPQQVIVEQSVDAGYGDANEGPDEDPEVAHGQGDDGFGDPFQDGYSPGGPTVYRVTSGDHYSVQSGSQTVTVDCSPSSSAPPDPDADEWFCWVDCSVSISPVTISLTGTTRDSGGNQNLLTGQQVKATLNGTVGTVTNYTWSAGGSTFKDYDTTAPNSTNATQLVPLGSADLTGPAAGGTTVADLYFYDGKQESVTVSCDATMTAPDGTSLSVSVTAPQISVVKPSITYWGIDTGFVRSLYASGNGHEFGLFKDPGSSNDDEGEQWHDVTVSVPPLFSGGQCTFTQLANPNRQAYTGNTPTPIEDNNGQIGLDGSFLYGDVWSLPGAGRDGDSPALIANGNQNYTQLTASDALTTYVMYMPPSSGTGTVWVPLQKYSWSWSETLSWQNAQWDITASYPATLGAAPHYTPQDTDDPPQWSVTHTR